MSVNATFYIENGLIKLKIDVDQLRNEIKQNLRTLDEYRVFPLLLLFF